MRREFKEETGADVTDWRRFVVLSGSDWQVFFFMASPPSGTYPLTKMTDEEVGYHDLGNLPKTIPNLKWLIPLALDKDRVNGEIREWDGK